MNNKKRFFRFETVQEYQKWAKGPYHKPHFIVVIFPGEAIYACLRIANYYYRKEETDGED